MKTTTSLSGERVSTRCHIFPQLAGGPVNFRRLPRRVLLIVSAHHRPSPEGAAQFLAQGAALGWRAMQLGHRSAEGRSEAAGAATKKKSADLNSDSSGHNEHFPRLASHSTHQSQFHHSNSPDHQSETAGAPSSSPVFGDRVGSDDADFTTTSQASNNAQPATGRAGCPVLSVLWKGPACHQRSKLVFSSSLCGDSIASHSGTDPQEYFPTLG
jgi:hypothetical protein